MASREHFDLNDAVAAFYADFPDHLGKTFFVDAATGAIAHPDKDVVAELKALIEDSEVGKNSLQPVMEACRRDKTSHVEQDASGSAIIFMYTGNDRPRFLAPGVSPARELQFIFDHETGHVVAPEGGSSNRLLAENAADAFALMRDLQRNGAASALPAQALLFRTNHAAYHPSGMINFSGPTLEKIIEDAPRIANNGASPAETAATAGNYARQNTLTRDAAQKLFDSFEPLHHEQPRGVLTNLVLTTDQAETFKWTSTVLKALLAKKLKPQDGLADEFNARAAQILPMQIAQRAQQFNKAAKPRATRMPPPRQRFSPAALQAALSG